MLSTPISNDGSLIPPSLHTLSLSLSLSLSLGFVFPPGGFRLRESERGIRAKRNDFPHLRAALHGYNVNGRNVIRSLTLVCAGSKTYLAFSYAA